MIIIALFALKKGRPPQSKAQRKLFREANRERLLKEKREYHYANKEYCNNKSKEYAAKNPEYVKEYTKSYYEKNRERIKRERRTYCKENPDKILANNAWRKAYTLQRVPTWANREIIEEFYKVARELTIATGIQHHVDHIIPLKGKLVSGLHVETNLRVITATENLSKNNKLIEELL